MSKVLRFLLGGFCLVGLLYIRFRENVLFYDPLIDYFHGDYQNNPLPEFETTRLFLHVTWRYTLNMILSFGILWAAFMDTSVIKFAVGFYVAVFILLIMPFYYFLFHHNPSEYLPLFYVRRFLIQPLLIFLILPAFLYSLKVNR